MEVLNTGIPELDEMLGRGIPKGSLVSVLGSPGTGKSTLALQFIYAGLQNGENCAYISLEESEEDIIRNAEMFGWDLKPFLMNKSLTLIRFKPQNIKAAIDRIANDFPKFLKGLGIKRLALDSITLYEMLFDSNSKRRECVFNLVEMIKECGITGILTSEVSMDNSNQSKYGLIEYIADGIIILRHIRQPDLRMVTTVIEVSKMRRTNHSKEIKPYNITQKGIIVYSSTEFFPNVIN